MGNIDTGLAFVLLIVSFFMGLLGSRIKDRIDNYYQNPDPSERNWTILFIFLLGGLCLGFLLMGFGILLMPDSPQTIPVDLTVNINCSTGILNTTNLNCTPDFSCPTPPPQPICPKQIPCPSFENFTKTTPCGMVLKLPK